MTDKQALMVKLLAMGYALTLTLAFVGGAEYAKLHFNLCVTQAK